MQTVISCFLTTHHTVTIIISVVDMNIAEKIPGIDNGQTRVPPPVYIMVQPTTTSDKDHFQKTFPKRIVAGLAATQIFIFLVAIISEIILITHVLHPLPISLGSGIWCGVFLAICGILGLLASWRPTQCIIVAYMVLSIFSTILATAPIITGGIGSTNNHNYYYHDGKNGHLLAATYGILCFCGLVQLVLGIASAVMCCRAVCCRSGKTTGAVVYNSDQAAGGSVAEETTGVDGMSSAVSVQATLLRKQGGGGDTVEVPMGGSVALSSAAINLEKNGSASSVEGEKYQRFQ